MTERPQPTNSEQLRRTVQLAQFRSLWTARPSDQLVKDALNAPPKDPTAAVFGLGHGLDDDNPLEQLKGWFYEKQEHCEGILKNVDLLPHIKYWFGEIIWVAAFTSRSPEEILPLTTVINEATFHPKTNLEPLEGYILQDLAAKVKTDPGVDSDNVDPLMHEARRFLAEMTQEFTEKYGLEEAMKYRISNQVQEEEIK